MPLLTPQSAASRRLEEILAEEDEAELVRSNVEWLERFHNAVSPCLPNCGPRNTLLAGNRRMALKSDT